MCTEDIGGKDSMQGSLHSDLKRTKISDFQIFLLSSLFPGGFPVSR